MPQETAMKLRSVLPHIGAILLMYAGWLGYFYYRDYVAHPSVNLQMPLPAVPSSLSNSIQADAIHVAAHVESTMSDKSVVEQQRSEIAISDTRHVAQVMADASQYTSVQNQDDLPALSALMSDPDPEVARVAGDAYNARLQGIR